MKDSFKFAFKGIASAVKRERNMRVHTAVAFYVIVVGLIAGIRMYEWIAVIVCIGAVLAAELLNTALEELCDALHPGRSDAIGRAKDISAGAVLVFAIAAAAVGIIVFFNAGTWTSLVDFAKTHIILTAVIIVTLPIAAFLVFKRYDNDKKDRHDNAGRQA